ncbi:hypothetical protein SAMN02799622_05571 [Methylobacterium sp. UNC378MF]|uniref:hypothetical protein n=1 Tax=Methylobacterium sp. UNC378MF TaxID=1502748 RepID=UPI00088E1600|nr:hypothetical protein [Methylobacterium sp. UNC378MF]SDA33612.1 hypothetical protein SAMN02799622_05571 [Methylobacterium sp. UNC378MF]
MFTASKDRELIVREARSWIGTPYHPGADLRGVGVDCGMLLVRVFVDAGLVPAFDPRPYPQDWHLHRGDERYLGFVFDRAAEVVCPQPGDVALFRYGRAYAHAGIVTGTAPLTLVHAFSPAQAVIEEPIMRNPVLAEPGRRPRFFSLWAARATAEADPV